MQISSSTDHKTELEATAAELIAKAKTRILTRPKLAFFGDILKRQFEPDWSIPTACTDGDSVWYSPAFIAGLSLEQVTFTLLHEVLHVKLGHCHRRGKRDPRLWNEAADYVINLMIMELRDNENIQFIPGVLLTGGISDMSTEQLYETLDKHPDQRQKLKDQFGPGGGTDPVETKDSPAVAGKTEQQKEEAIAQHEAEVRKDAAASEMAGNMPGKLKKMFDAHYGAPQLNWKSVLADFALSRARCEYDWNRYDRRYVSQGFYLPSKGGTQIEEAALIFDNSISIDVEAAKRFVAEFASIRDAVTIDELHVLHVDTRVNYERVYEPDDEIDPSFKSGGGTSFVPGFEHLDKQGVEPAFVIYFTYGCCSRYPEEPEYPVLWVLAGKWVAQNFEPPFGTVTKLTD